MATKAKATAIHYAEKRGIALCGRKSKSLTFDPRLVTCNACAKKWLKAYN